MIIQTKIGSRLDWFLSRIITPLFNLALGPRTMVEVLVGKCLLCGASITSDQFNAHQRQEHPVEFEESVVRMLAEMRCRMYQD